jgi:hypothetical protein
MFLGREHGQLPLKRISPLARTVYGSMVVSTSAIMVSSRNEEARKVMKSERD